MDEKIIKVALIGQPNVGKSTIFNHFTGLNQHIGNWPGKTVEKKSGVVFYEDYKIEITDLPGTYSLTSNSEEERIARDFIIKEKPDVIILLLNASSLERSLYLLSELLILETKIVIGLNMVDVAKKNGINIKSEKLERITGIKSVELIATKNVGLKELLKSTIETYEENAIPQEPPTIKENHRRELSEIESILKDVNTNPYPKRWVSIKLLEGDKEITSLLKSLLNEKWADVHKILSKHEDAYLDIVGSRYEWISSLVKHCVEKPKPQIITITDRIDKYATHPIYGVIVLLVALFILFFLTYTIANPIVKFLSESVRISQDYLNNTFIFSPFLKGLLFDGILGGAGMVLSFLPILILFFFFLGILEDVGYLSRIAYIMDNFMHKIGLHGKSFVPLCLGFGCNVPAVMGSRIIEESKARLLTILLIPFIPCTGRLAVVSFLAPVFFGKKSTFAMIFLILLNIIILFVIGKILSVFLLKGVKSAFIMELPLYHKVNFKTVSIYTYSNIKSFVSKAASIIVIVSALIWIFNVYPSVDDSYLSKIGKTIEPLGKLMGFEDYRVTTALLTSFVAKENTIATFGVLYKTPSEKNLQKEIGEHFTFPSAISFLIVQMLFIPCLATVIAITKEKGRSLAFISILIQIFVSLLFGILSYNILRIFYA
jgi:ferrous iron transport protein B